MLCFEKQSKLSNSVSIKRTQFPLTLAYASTIYKVQGKTLKKIIIDLKKPTYSKYHDAFIYVALSRVKSIEDILILRDFDKAILKRKVSQDLIIEMKRLDNIEINYYKSQNKH